MCAWIIPAKSEKKTSIPCRKTCNKLTLFARTGLLSPRPCKKISNVAASDWTVSFPHTQFDSSLTYLKHTFHWQRKMLNLYIHVFKVMWYNESASFHSTSQGKKTNSAIILIDKQALAWKINAITGCDGARLNQGYETGLCRSHGDKRTAN